MNYSKSLILVIAITGILPTVSAMSFEDMQSNTRTELINQYPPIIGTTVTIIAVAATIIYGYKKFNPNNRDVGSRYNHLFLDTDDNEIS